MWFCSSRTHLCVSTSLSCWVCSVVSCVSYKAVVNLFQWRAPASWKMSFLMGGGMHLTWKCTFLGIHGVSRGKVRDNDLSLCYEPKYRFRPKAEMAAFVLCSVSLKSSRKKPRKAKAASKCFMPKPWSQTCSLSVCVVYEALSAVFCPGRLIRDAARDKEGSSWFVSVTRLAEELGGSMVTLLTWALVRPTMPPSWKQQRFQFRILDLQWLLVTQCWAASAWIVEENWYRCYFMVHKLSWEQRI